MLLITKEAHCIFLTLTVDLWHRLRYRIARVCEGRDNVVDNGRVDEVADKGQSTADMIETRAKQSSNISQDMAILRSSPKIRLYDELRRNTERCLCNWIGWRLCTLSLTVLKQAELERQCPWPVPLEKNEPEKVHSQVTRLAPFSFTRNDYLVGDSVTWGVKVLRSSFHSRIFTSRDTVDEVYG